MSIAIYFIHAYSYILLCGIINGQDPQIGLLTVQNGKQYLSKPVLVLFEKCLSSNDSAISRAEIAVLKETVSNFVEELKELKKGILKLAFETSFLSNVSKE